MLVKKHCFYTLIFGESNRSWLVLPSPKMSTWFACEFLDYKPSSTLLVDSANHALLNRSVPSLASDLCLCLLAIFGWLGSLRPFLTVRQNKNKTPLLFLFCYLVVPNGRQNSDIYLFSFVEPKKITHPENKTVTKTFGCLIPCLFWRWIHPPPTTTHSKIAPHHLINIFNNRRLYVPFVPGTWYSYYLAGPWSFRMQVASSLSPPSLYG